ncbi:MAG: GNAT family N-acetyltransferase [Candidatus Shapirobacteria bacterium]
MITNNKFSWCVGDYQRKYKKSILGLFKKEYPESVLWKDEFFEWQHFKNPAGESIIKLAINTKEEVVGFYCVLLQDYFINRKLFHGSISLSTLVREDYRGMGIFTILAQECYKECFKRGVKFTLGFPNQNSYPGFIRKLGFLNLGELPLLIKPYRLSNLVAEKLNSGVMGMMVRPIDFLINLFNKDSCCGLSEDMTDSFHDLFWRKARKKYQIVANRDARFIDWRTKWPERKYKYFCVKKNNKIEGYIILGLLGTKNVKNGLIVDFVVNDSSDAQSIGNDLLKETNHYWKMENVDQAGCLISKNSFEFKLLRKNGYFICPNFLKPQPMVAVFKWHGNDCPLEVSDLQKWYITTIDYDVA